MKKRFTEAQIVGFLREADAGIPVKDLCRKHGFSEASYYLWRSKLGGMSVSDAKRARDRKHAVEEIARGVSLGNRGDPSGAAKKVVTAPARREVVREIVVRGLSERRALTVVRMSAAALRYVPRPDPDPDLRERIVTLAHRHRRYDAGMIYLKAAPGRCVVNHKRVDRRYAEARRQVRRRRRKKVPFADRQPLARPQAPNEVWSADFVFDRTAEGRVLNPDDH